jgi:hypothetical protein
MNTQVETDIKTAVKIFVLFFYTTNLIIYLNQFIKIRSSIFLNTNWLTLLIYLIHSKYCQKQYWKIH